MSKIEKCHLDECHYNEDGDCYAELIELDESGQCITFYEKE